MKDSTKKTLKRIGEIIVTIITALLSTLGAHAAGSPVRTIMNEKEEPTV